MTAKKPHLANEAFPGLDYILAGLTERLESMSQEPAMHQVDVGMLIEGAKGMCAQAKEAVRAQRGQEMGASLGMTCALILMALAHKDAHDWSSFLEGDA